MYCPRCGQQQVSDEMRFCSRCGLPMSGLGEWISGVVPAARAQETQVSAPSPRRKKIRRAAKLMFISGVLFPVCLAIAAAADDPGLLILPSVLFFISLVMMLYAWLFSEKTPPVETHTTETSRFGATPAPGSLPPAPNIPMHGVGGQVRTNELVHRPSVTENTTKLLDKE